MALYGRSYTYPIIRRGADFIEPAPRAPVYVVSQTTQPVQQVSYGRSYSYPIVRRGADYIEPAPRALTYVIAQTALPVLGSKRIILRGDDNAAPATVPTTAAPVVITQLERPVPGVTVTGSAAPSVDYYATSLIISAFPSISKRYTTFSTNVPTDSAPTTTTAQPVVVSHRRFPPKVLVRFWIGDPNAAPLVLGTGPPHICFPTDVNGPTRVTDIIGTLRVTHVTGTVRTTDIVGTVRTSDVTGTTRTSDVTGTVRTTDISGRTRTTDTGDLC